MNWIDELIQDSSIITPNHIPEQRLIDKMVRIAYSDTIQREKRGLALAAFYDLAIAAAYYSCITNSGWIYCRNDGNPKLVLPFVNCCPIHAINGQFVFHKSSKPTSAIIGTATSRVLLLFFQSIFNKTGKKLKVYNASEPADAIILDNANHNAFFAEIKASPLLTMAIAMGCNEITDTDERGNQVSVEHCSTKNTNLFGSDLFVMLPKEAEAGKWKFTYYPLGKKANKEDVFFSYSGISSLLDDVDFINDYLSYWKTSFNLYCQKDNRSNIFWFTNACGKPAPLPDDWEGGTTCISDAKTSVGMDRTDDIKKGIYQVLKLGSEGKHVHSKWNYKVGIISNIHPARHFTEYIKPIKDLIWTTATEKNIKFAADLPKDTPLYNLFDGILTFTESYIRDSWLQTDFFGFEE